MFDGDTIFRVPAINDTHEQCRTLDGALGVFEAQIKNVLRDYAEFDRLMMAPWLGPKPGPSMVPVAVANTATLMEQTNAKP